MNCVPDLFEQRAVQQSKDELRERERNKAAAINLL